MTTALENAPAEEAVLGAVLLDPLTLAKVRPLLPLPQAFTRSEYAELYRGVLALSDRSAPLDAVTIATECAAALGDRVQAVCADLVDAAVTTANVEAHAGLVLEAWRRRLLAAEAQRLQRAAADPGQAVADVVAQLTGRLVRIGAADPGTKPPSLRGALFDALERLEDAVRSPDEIRGVPTGFRSLDRMTDGLRDTQLVILAARPSEGKSSIALSIARHAARTTGPVYLNSLEMGADELVERLIQAEARVDLRKLRQNPGDFDRHVARVAAAANRLAALPLTIDTDTRTVATLRLRLLGEIAQGRRPRLVLVDYLGLMDPDERQQNRDREVGTITKGLKRLAMELGIPVVALSQLSRLSVRENRPPRLDDLRDSGNIEQDANVVLLLHWPEGDVPREVPVSLYVAKNRNGPRGVIDLRFEPWFQRWRELYDDGEPELPEQVELGGLSA